MTGKLVLFLLLFVFFIGYCSFVVSPAENSAVKYFFNYPFLPALSPAIILAPKARESNIIAANPSIAKPERRRIPAFAPANAGADSRECWIPAPAGRE